MKNLILFSAFVLITAQGCLPAPVSIPAQPDPNIEKSATAAKGVALGVYPYTSITSLMFQADGASVGARKRLRVGVDHARSVITVTNATYDPSSGIESINCSREQDVNGYAWLSEHLSESALVEKTDSASSNEGSLFLTVSTTNGSSDTFAFDQELDDVSVPQGSQVIDGAGLRDALLSVINLGCN